MVFSISPRNSLGSEAEAVKVPEQMEDEAREQLIPALLASGFIQIPSNRTDYDTFLPCPAGTFSNSSSKGRQGCIQCPPGKSFELICSLLCLTL